MAISPWTEEHVPASVYHFKYDSKWYSYKLSDEESFEFHNYDKIGKGLPHTSEFFKRGWVQKDQENKLEEDV